MQLLCNLHSKLCCGTDFLMSINIDLHHHFYQLPIPSHLTADPIREHLTYFQSFAIKDIIPKNSIVYIFSQL